MLCDIIYPPASIKLYILAHPYNLLPTGLAIRLKSTTLPAPYSPAISTPAPPLPYLIYSCSLALISYTSRKPAVIA